MNDGTELDEYIAASIDFIKQYHNKGYDLIADRIIAEGLEELAGEKDERCRFEKFK